MNNVKEITAETLKCVLDWEKQHINYISTQLKKVGETEGVFPKDNLNEFYSDLALMLNNDNGYESYRSFIVMMAEKKKQHKLEHFAKTYFLDGRWFEKATDFIRTSAIDIDLGDGWRIEEDPEVILSALDEIDTNEAKHFKDYYYWWREVKGSSVNNEEANVADTLETEWKDCVYQCNEAIKTDLEKPFNTEALTRIRNTLYRMEGLIEAYEKLNNDAAEDYKKQLLVICKRIDELLDSLDYEYSDELKKHVDVIENNKVTYCESSRKDIDSIDSGLSDWVVAVGDLLVKKDANKQAIEKDDYDLSSQLVAQLKELKKHSVSVKHRVFAELAAITNVKTAHDG